MPPVRRQQNAPNMAARLEPYPDLCEHHRQARLEQDEGTDKENQQPPCRRSSNKGKKTTRDRQSRETPLPDNYLDITLHEVKGEVPIYEDVRVYHLKKAYSLLIVNTGSCHTSQNQ